MEQVSISPKFQVVIPKEIREQFHLKPGEKLVMLPYAGRIELIVRKDLKSMRGILKGIDTGNLREVNDRI